MVGSVTVSLCIKGRRTAKILPLAPKPIAGSSAWKSEKKIALEENVARIARISVFECCRQISCQKTILLAIVKSISPMP
ncbi:hypothetical protein KP509_23G007700 [Ceratopteris richardii]|uniref:Uncharacterized protein n=1 Tax=Ceratopteris richardii TaxID=49495 RepID=A0A8T2RWP8_CERRI|nr:hypothetical protein KP509_23G007700 [Ceratopteris richardii]